MRDGNGFSAFLFGAGTHLRLLRRHLSQGSFPSHLCHVSRNMFPTQAMTYLILRRRHVRHPVDGPRYTILDLPANSRVVVEVLEQTDGGDLGIWTFFAEVKETHRTTDKSKESPLLWRICRFPVWPVARRPFSMISRVRPVL